MESTLIQNRDIIMLGIQPWDVPIGCNFKNMAHEIALHNRVLYVNRPLDRVTKWKNPADIRTKNRLSSIKKGINVIEEVADNLWIFNPQTQLESINWMPDGKFYNYLNKRNNKLLAAEIRKAMKELQFTDPVLFIDNDFYNGLYLPDFLEVDITVYYLRDFLLAQPYFAKHGMVSEPKMIAKADLVVTNSLYLTSYAKKYNLESFYTGQGCGEEFFAPPPHVFPDDIRNIMKPVIGYCGFLTAMRLDIRLLEKIALSHPEWNIVLIGPEDEVFQKSVLHSISNIYFLGNKNEKLLPDYVHYFDVCLNPQVVNQLTIGNYPRKVDEYLAAGKPVVATKTETMLDFEDSVSLCDNASEFIAAIENALSGISDKEAAMKRMEVARSHSWKNSIGKFYSAVNNYNKIRDKNGVNR
ncbi:MAG: glycosyltransferase [Ferruginibacter sp.]